MSSESDGGGSPRGWTLVNKHGRAEDSEDSSSGSSSDFVDLEDDQVRYHVRRSSSVVDITPGNLPSPPASASSLPANFRAHFGGSAHPYVKNGVSSTDDDHNTASGEPCDEAAELRNHGDASARIETTAQRRIEGEQTDEWNQPCTSDNWSLDLDKSTSSGSTLTISQSPLPCPPSSNDNQGVGEGIQPDCRAISQSSLSLCNEEEMGVSEDCSSLDGISVDSIEVLLMPPDRGTFFGGEVEMMKVCGEAAGGEIEGADDGSRQETVPASVSTAAVFTEKANEIPDHGEDACVSCPSEESDVSEFERIEPEVIIPSVDAVPNQPDNDDEAYKMDVAGARPIGETIHEQDTISNVPLRPFDPAQNIAEAQSSDREDTYSPLCYPLNLSPPNNTVPSPPNIPPWRDQSAPSIRPFPLDSLPVDGVAHPRRSPSGLQLPSRFGMSRQQSHNSSDDGFELLPRRQDDDAASSVSSSSSDISGFVNVRQRRGSSLSRSLSSHHSDLDDMDSVSNFTDISEDCLPANMMIQSQKSGVRQYKHRRDDGLNTQLDWLVAMVLLAGLALGIGHFIGSSQELAHQNSINISQVQRLRELQDDLVTCLDRSSGIDSRVMTEKSSPALQAVKLLEGLNVKMLEEGLDASRLLEQKVGPDDLDAATDSDYAWGSTAEEEQPIRVLNDITAESNKEEASEDVVVEPQSPSLQESSLESRHFSQGLESADHSESRDHNGLGSEVTDNVRELPNDKIISSGDEKMLAKAPGISHGSDGESLKLIDGETKKDLGDNAKETQDATQEDALKEQQELVEVNSYSKEKYPDGEGMEVDITFKDHGTNLNSDLDPGDQTQDRLKSVDDGVPPESPTSDHEASTVEVLQRKMELMEEKMNEMIKTARQWQEMLEESKRTDESSEEHQSEETDHSSGKSEGGSDEADEKENDSLAGIAATLQSLWPDVLNTDQGKEFLQYINETEASFYSDTKNQSESSSWSEAFYREIAALKALSDSEEVQAIVNNTKLFAAHLGKEMESMSEYLRSQSAKLVEENNITMEGLGEQATKAWTTLKNVTANVVDYNKMVLSTVGEGLTDTFHSIENVSAEILTSQNLSLSSVGNVAGQVWGTVKNYSAMVRDKIMNNTLNSTTDAQSGFDNQTSSSESEGGFRESLQGAWDTVRNYSSNFTSKQNLSISGLRDQVKAAWVKVKNSSAQVLENISEANIGEKFKDGAQKLGEKVETVIHAVKAKVKRLYKKKRHHGKKKRQSHSKRQQQNQRRAENNHLKKKHKHHQKQREQEEGDDFHSGKGYKKKSHKRHYSHHKVHGHHNTQFNEDQHRGDYGFDRGNDEEPEEHKHHYSVPSRHQHQWNPHGHANPDSVEIHDHDESNGALHSQQTQGHLYSAPSRPQWVLPTHGEAGVVGEEGPNLGAAFKQDGHKPDKQNSVPSRPQWVLPSHGEAGVVGKEGPNLGAAFKQDRHKPDKQNSVPSRQQIEQPIKLSAAKNKDQSGNDKQGFPKDEKVASREHRKKSAKRCPPHEARLSPKDNWESIAESSWEDLFDCVDMHCKGDEECMHSQRRDAVKLYAELLDYQEWLKEHDLQKDVQELKEFLEELGEFLSETDSNDQDLDELKDEFGEMVQDMEDGARKRVQRQYKMRGGKLTKGDTDPAEDAQKQALVDDLKKEENTTIIINLQSLPQQQDPKSASSGDAKRRKFAGRGFHSVDEDDWYFQRAKDRAEQRESQHLSGDKNQDHGANWYLHWAQGRINGRTGVTVWDMYEWIKQRYVFREELRRHEMKDHTNWFLRRP